MSSLPVLHSYLAEDHTLEEVVYAHVVQLGLRSAALRDAPCCRVEARRGWRPLIAGCSSLQGPEAWNGLTPSPPSLGFEPRTSRIRPDPLPTEL